MAVILIGTSGYYYDDWKGLFYPDLKKKNYLKHYSLHFNVLELNFTYYRLPEYRQMKGMIEKAENRLLFIVKAYRGITHEISDNSIDTILPRIREISRQTVKLFIFFNNHAKSQAVTNSRMLIKLIK